ncbi:3640_t:CDS:1, partial [Acaulospora morrowiae]
MISDNNKSLLVKEINISTGAISKNKLETVNKDNNISKKVKSLLKKEIDEP